MMSDSLQLPYLPEKHQIAHSAKTRDETKVLRERWIKQNQENNTCLDVDYWPTLRKHLPPHLIRKQLRIRKKQEVHFQLDKEKEGPGEIWRKEFNERWTKEVVKRDLINRLKYSRSTIVAYPIGDNKNKVQHSRPTFEENFFYQTDNPKNVKSRYFVAPDWKSEKTSWKMFNSSYVPAIHLCSLF